MKNVLLASAAVALFALAGCTSGDSMMMKDDAMAKEAVETQPVTYNPPPAAPAGDAMAADASGDDAMMNLCLSKGGSIGEWPGEESGTKTCQADGNEYPLAMLSSFPAFQ